MTSEIMVKAEGLGKKFKLYDSPSERLKEWLSFGNTVRHEDFWALKDISFEVKRGECFGIIGENGSGKSTLLKIINGSLWITEGMHEIRGKALSILELNAGFNPELTGRQNLVNTTNLLGFPDDYLNDERVNSIREFADIGEFFDRPIKLYSSGMNMRLAFAMYIFMEPEVLIIDEALSVGDIFFSQKCFAKIRELMESGMTFIFVSHDLDAVQNLSDRVMLLNHGKCAYIGLPEIAIGQYWAIRGKSYEPQPVTGNNKNSKPGAGSFIMDPAEIKAHSVLTGKNAHGNGNLKIIAARVTDNDGVDTLSAPLMGKLRFYIYARAIKDIKDPRFGVLFCDRMNNLVFSSTTLHLGVKFPDLAEGEEIVVGLKVEMSVQPGAYTFSLSAGEFSDDPNPNVGTLCDSHGSLGPIEILFDYSKSLAPFHGMAQLPMSIIGNMEPH